MNRLGQLWLWAACGLALTPGGCYVWAAGGNVMVEAFAVSDDYTPAIGAYAAHDPAPEQLQSLSEVVLIPFYAQTSQAKIELRNALRVSGRGGRVGYPARPYISGFTVWSSAFVIDHAAIVFAPECWPRIIYADSNPPGGCIWEKIFPPDRRRPPGVDQLMRVCLFRRTRPYDDHVDRAANDDSFRQMLQIYLDDLTCAIDAAPLSKADRLMVYRQLAAVADGVIQRCKPGPRRSVYEAGARCFQARIRGIVRGRRQ